ncbi:MAG: deoxyhypusine synthase family protein [Nitrospiraceae bacterium]|nr:deoxyhypusine synthase family protein [Nitrospiraceae bacterium]
MARNKRPKFFLLDLKKIKTVPLAGRKSKVELELAARPPQPGDSFMDFWNGLPNVLAASNIKRVVEAIARARENDRPVVLGMGAHPIKVGLSPLIIDLMRRGIITAVATNGAAIVHDFELAFMGRTSEDVAEELCKGTFGMARETGLFLNRAIKKGAKDGLGLGESIGALITGGRFPFKEKSIFATGYDLGIPATVHVTMGADIIHMHPSADGASIGEATMRDFRLFASVLSQLEGGVYINLGSAVVMPEVFLKALTVARNLGHETKNITTVNMDFIQHYRPRENVLMRPTLRGGISYALTGHHEIMFPLLAAGLIERMGKNLSQN